MSTDITSYSSKLDDLRVVTLTDGEVWSARDLMDLAGYDRWERFSDAITRAIASTNASGLDASDHFRGSAKLVQVGSGAKRQIEDVELTRYGCYILFQNADARKPEIAAAQRYFAVQTRKQEMSITPSTELIIDPTSIEGITLILAAAQNALAKVKELEPKADAWDAIASAVGDYSVGDAAKMLARAGIPTGPQRLFEQMGEIKWTYRGEAGKWHAYADRVEKGYLAHRPMFHFHPKSGERVIDPPQLRVTVKGLDRLRLRLHVGALQAVTA